MILVIDNYDSFTYNLVHYLGEVLGVTGPASQAMHVVRNDQITVADIERLSPRAIILSPGPCTPNEAGICLELVPAIAGRIPLLGVCLGHQAIAQAFGAAIVRADEVMHGKTDTIHHNGEGIFHGIDQAFVATRYHSLIVDEATLPEQLDVTARARDGKIMAFAHREHTNLIGLQFHPESILTGVGKQLLRNFLTL